MSIFLPAPPPVLHFPMRPATTLSAPSIVEQPGDASQRDSQSASAQNAPQLEIGAPFYTPHDIARVACVSLRAAQYHCGIVFPKWEGWYRFDHAQATRVLLYVLKVKYRGRNSERNKVTIIVLSQQANAQIAASRLKK